MDVISYALSKKYVDDTVVGMGSLKGSNCYITSIVDNSDGTHDITFSWKDTSDITHTSVLTVFDGETPTFSSTVITGGHRITFTTEDRTVSFDVMDGSKGDSGISVVSSNVDDNNNLTFTLSNGNTISAGKINAVTVVDTALSTSSSNPVENKVITNALNNKVDKESGKSLSTEDFTTSEKDKLSNIEDNAQVNVIEKLIINGTEATVTDKSVALTLITSAVSNLQNYYLKTETYTKTEIEDLIGSTVGVTIEIVEELPTEGQTNIIYFLPTETEDVYSQYIYTTDGWILIGSTTVDLSNYYTKTQVDTLLAAKQNTLTIDSFPTSLSNNPVASGGVYTAIAQMQSQFQYTTMPTASVDNLGYVYQYIGATGTYTQNMFYRCVYDDTLGEYQWQEVIFNATVTIDSAISSTSENPVQNKVIKAALDEKQDIIQYSTMPSAQDNLGKIVQYSGTTTSTYTNGYFYKATYDSENDLYYWKQIVLAEGLTVDSVLSDSSENPVQNQIITNAITEITDLIPSEASSSNQLVDRDSLGTASQKDSTSYVRPNNYDLVESNAVYNAIANSISSIYTPHGNITVAELLPALLISTNVGNVYTVTDSGTTTEYFMQGEGVTINSGDAVGIIQAGEDTTSILFNLMGNMTDLSEYQTKTLDTTLTIDGAEVTDVEDALSALNTLADSKQDTLTFDTTPTNGSTNPVTSDGVYDSINDVYVTNGVLGAKNLIPYPYFHESYTNRGITFTSNSDGTVSYSGTADNSLTAYMTIIEGTLYLKAGTYILSSGNDAYGGTSIYLFDDSSLSTNYSGTYSGDLIVSGGYITTATTSNSTVTWTESNTYGYEKTFTIASSAYVRIQTRSVNTNYTSAVSGTIYPMLRYASDTDSTYVPYAMTNQQITPYIQSISNPNLLDNPWFTVNQRGLTTLSTAGYLFDRWKMVVDIGTMNARENGLEIDATSNAVTLAQQYDTNDSTVKRIFEDDLNEYTYSIDFTVLAKPSDNTLSFALFSNITGQSGTLKVILNVKPDDVVIGQRYLKSGSSVLGYTIEDSATSLALAWAFFRAGWKIIIHSIKVEKGSISTLAMDTAPNYATELAKCQRYYQEFRATSPENMWIASGFSPNSNSIEVVLDLAVPMRTKPSVTITDTYATNATEEIGLSTIQVLQADVNNSKLHMNISTSSSLTNVLGVYAFKLLASTGKVAISADL